MKTDVSKHGHRFSEQDLIALLQKKAETLKRSPTADEVDMDVSMPSSGTFIRRFGSFGDALQAAGLEARKKRNKSRLYSDAQLIALLQSKAKKLRHTPTVRELNADSDMPSHDTYVKRFGSFSGALKEAGLRTRH